MNYSGIINCSIVDGVGFRVALYISGCRHCCEGCHNKETWDFNNGKKFTPEAEDILFDRLDKSFIKGLTLTGGDPLYSAKELIGLVERFRERFGDSKDLWLYTGFKMDDIMETDDDKRKLVEMCDYVVDGEFKIKDRDIKLPFRGSPNQIIWEKDSGGEGFRPSSLN